MSPAPNLLHTRWLTALQAGDESAFKSIYQHFWHMLYSVAYNYVRDRQVAEELVQELFTTLWTKRYELGIHSSLQAYLLKSIRNQVYDYIDKQSVRLRVHDAIFHAATETSYPTDEEIAYKDLQMHLNKAVEQLPEPARTIFRMSRFDYQSSQDIAKKLKLSPKTIEYHLTRALRILRFQLRDFI